MAVKAGSPWKAKRKSDSSASLKPLIASHLLSPWLKSRVRLREDIQVLVCGEAELGNSGSRWLKSSAAWLSYTWKHLKLTTLSGWGDCSAGESCISHSTYPRRHFKLINDTHAHNSISTLYSFFQTHHRMIRQICPHIPIDSSMSQKCGPLHVEKDTSSIDQLLKPALLSRATP